MRVSVEDVKRLREASGAGVMDCKRALEKAEGDFDKAVQILRAEGMVKATDKMHRAASDGIVTCYIHTGSRIGVLLELNCETDFVARTEEFKRLAYDVAMQITAMSPQYISREDVPPEVVERERVSYLTEAEASGHSRKQAEQLADARMARFFEENCLLQQPFIKDETKTVDELIKEAIAQLKENIVVNRFVRFAIGSQALFCERKAKGEG